MQTNESGSPYPELPKEPKEDNKAEGLKVEASGDQPQTKQIKILNKDSVPLIGGNANGNRIEYGGFRIKVQSRKYGTIVAKEAYTLVDEFFEARAMYEGSGEALIVYVLMGLSNLDVLAHFVRFYGRLDMRLEKKLVTNTGRQGKAVH